MHSGKYRILTDQELIDWERWSGREIAWKPEDVQRLVETVKHDRARLRDLDDLAVLVPHGSTLYDEVVRLRYRVLRKPLGMVYTPEQLAAEAPYMHLALLRGGEVVACLYCYPQDGNALRVKQVAVKPELQGQGLGRTIMEAAERLAASIGASQVVLNARQAAFDFYSRIGYEPFGEPFEEVGISHWSMAKRVGVRGY